MPTPKPLLSDPTLFVQKVNEGLGTEELAKLFNLTKRTIQRYYHRFNCLPPDRVGSYEGFKGTIQQAVVHFGVPEHCFEYVKAALARGTSYDTIIEVAVEKFRNAKKNKANNS